MTIVQKIMSLRASAATSDVVKALGEAGGDEAVKAIMSLRASAATSDVMRARGRAGRNGSRQQREG